jgi:NAD(P)H dehydrogenase (quinone)
MILVTGAGGKTGHAVVRALSASGVDVRAMIRDPGKEAVLRRLGATEIVFADMTVESEVLSGFRNVRAVYLIAPNTHPAEERIGELAIGAAQSAGIEQLVYHSVLHPQTREMPHHWQKLAVEERLFESGLNFTVLQPAAYMQNVAAYWDSILAEGIYRVPYGEGGALSLVDLEDVAAVAARVLTSGEHNHAIYELAGPEALTPAAIAEALNQSLSREVMVELTSLAEWVEEAQAAGTAEYEVDTLKRMFHYYGRYGLRGNPGVLTWLLKRSPTTFTEFLGRLLHTA